MIALKKRMSFDELVQENRKQILEDRLFMEKIEEKLDQKKYQSLEIKKLSG